MFTLRRTILLSAAALMACSDAPTESNNVAIPPSDETVTIAPNPVSIQVGQTIALKAHGLGPGIVVVWSSDDPSVAEVAVGGFLRGINPGATYVTARAGTASAAAQVIVGRARSPE
jgi:hypothetical protein